MNRRKTAPPRGVLKTAAAAPQRYQHARYHASPDLAPYVEHYWSVEWDLRGLAPERAETLPHPSVHMIFERNVGGRIAGVARGKFSRLLEGEGGVLAAKFRPGGFHPFVGVPISTFTDTVATLRDVFGAEGAALERAVLAECADASRITVVEELAKRGYPHSKNSRMTLPVPSFVTHRPPSRQSRVSWARGPAMRLGCRHRRNASSAGQTKVLRIAVNTIRGYDAPSIRLRYAAVRVPAFRQRDGIRRDVVERTRFLS